ncbi:PREDICTED: uncharacterized protein LOC106751229 isoform X3 [Dinoponera quadriceps]|uniref:Uncharacterized protein LOC106751229 isoform X3 n=1 Tax=Dinoponera quadriceps TaxID=609295 RepID=A0A6P3Y9E6_DINQU|nr:PREDICTED: uncharacterized protein LOC106751229 isoform X3 [Dinoponera quadriceps]
MKHLTQQGGIFYYYHYGIGLIFLSIAYLITGQPIEWQRCSMFFGASLLTGFIGDLNHPLQFASVHDLTQNRRFR